MRGSGEDESWRKDLARIRERLDLFESANREEIKALKAALAALEFRRQSPVEPVKPAVPEPLPEPEPVRPPPLPKPVSVEATAPVQPAPRMMHPRPVPSPPTKEERVEEPEEGFELRFGRVWLVRLGVVLLLTGLVLLGNYAYQNWIRELPNGLRLAGLFACAFALVETGRRLAMREALAKFGEVVMAGGLAFTYYCVYAAHSVERLKVVDSPVLAAVLMFCAAGGIGWISWVRQAKATAVLGLVLASYATMVQPLGWLACFSNMMLAGAGLFLMTRRGWSGPGIASMAGTYGAFLGWQLLGAARAGAVEPWFLAPIWVMFALPGVLGIFREAMSDRARAWFTGANNAAFFVLFGAVWLMRHSPDDFWMVAAVFGVVLLGLGVLGRKRSEAAGGVNVSQGLGLVSLALILKLEGHHLGLALAGESLALSLAFWKFRGRSELAFSVLAAGISGLLMFSLDLTLIPIWSVALTAAVLTAASLVLRASVGRCGEGSSLAAAARALSGLVFFGSILLTGLWCARLPDGWPLPVAAGLSTLLCFASLKFDRRRAFAEVVYAGLFFLIYAAVWLRLTEQRMSFVAAALLVAPAVWFWHRHESGETAAEEELDPYHQPHVSAWGTSAFVTAALGFAVWLSGWSSVWETIGFGGVALVLIVLAVFSRCGRLAACAAFLPFAAHARMWMEPQAPGGLPPFLLVAFGLISLVPPALPMAASTMTLVSRVLAAGALRVSIFIGWCATCHALAPGSWGDWLALTALAICAFAIVRKSVLLVESPVFAVVALAWWVNETVTSQWAVLDDGASWRGAGVVLALLAIVLSHRHRPALIENQESRASVLSILGGVACFVTAVWSTQMLVWRYDWNGAAVLWTVLGFAAVSAGLWQRLRVFRQAGFLLLGLALVKVFAVDVWDFNAFMRVVAFMALGLALMLLGLFYHRFSPVLKRLLDEDKPTP